jgi:hypothetical protein
MKALKDNLLPQWFEYPKELIALLSNEGIDIGPWQILHGEWLEVRYKGVKERYPERSLIPFARRLDDDDIACFDVSSPSVERGVQIIHDFASAGWEERETYLGFNEWLEAAKEEAKEWED